jgi:hypothetical protein
MKCKFCGKELWDGGNLRSHMASHMNGYGREGLSVREFLLCVHLFFGEIPSATHIKEIVKATEKTVDNAMKEMEVTA